jgi:uncharacterized protein (TIGR02271 family)
MEGAQGGQSAGRRDDPPSPATLAPLTATQRDVPMADLTPHNDSFMDKLKRAFTGGPSDFDGHDDTYRQHHTTRAASGGTSGLPYERARTGYAAGHLAGSSADYDQRSFDDAEPDLRNHYESSRTADHGQWDEVRDYARDGYARGQEARMTVSREELVVGKRQVQAGEATLRKTVETEHVRETVPLMHEEVTIERHPISATSGVNATIGQDQEIRVPLMAEEAIAEKRVVGEEEVVLRKHQVEENRTVEADLRRERVDVVDGTDVRAGTRDNLTGGTLGGTLGGSHAAGTTGGLTDRLADKATT